MLFKYFKPPLLESAPISASVDLVEAESIPESPPAKRRRIDVGSGSPSVRKAPFMSSAVNTPRTPLLVVNNPSASQALPGASDGVEGYYMVLWRKFTAKKHKTWDGDGVLALSGGYARLQNIDGRDMGRCAYRDPILPGSTLSIGGKDIEVESVISKADFLAGRPFLGNEPKRTISLESTSSSTPMPVVVSSIPDTGKLMASRMSSAKRKTTGSDEESVNNFYASAQSTGMQSNFKNPLRTGTVVPQTTDGVPTPRHNPLAPNALVMKRPDAKDVPRGKQVVDVVLDPLLGRHLREHQKEGVKFLYECVMGMRSSHGRGAILADEMGLGKTLQTIALIWILLKQNPIYEFGAVIKKVLIVCPATLVGNWKKEFNKWLGAERIGVFKDGVKNTKIEDFTHGRSYSVAIIGYERLRKIKDELKQGGGIDLIIADEGHRLKSAANQSAQAIRALDTVKCIILSGTPVQNNLSEFYYMVDLVNPGALGAFNAFNREFERPISASREPGASKKVIEKGTAREQELSDLTQQFILRRTSEVLSKYLPPKTEYVLFCKPTEAQAEVYRHVLASPAFGALLGRPDASFLLITQLKKICNAPSLLRKKDEDIPGNADIAQLLKAIPASVMDKTSVQASIKFRVLDRMLKYLSKTTDEKIVIVSNYTTTLDLIQVHLAALSLPYSRLDGSTPAIKRQGLVDEFNRTDASKKFAFLISAKSGGLGLNLIGASRLVLFDIDWNPATDLQAMARIHRDGQKRPVKIYRFIMCGGIDENIYQRQIMKMDLADSVVDGKKNEPTFSNEELRDLWTLKEHIGCRTHDLLGCDCEGAGVYPASSEIDSGHLEDPSLLAQDSESDSDLPPIPQLVAASKANVAAINKRIADAADKRKKAKKGKMQALMQYAHVDTSVFLGDVEELNGEQKEEMERVGETLDDEILVNVLKQARCKIGFVFAKRG